MTYMSGGSTRVVSRAWPQSRRSRLELTIAPAAVRIARHWTAEQLGHGDLAGPGDLVDDDLVDSAVLAVSELVTNAITAAGKVAFPPSPARVWLAISRCARAVRIEVHDSACVPLPPAWHKDADADGESGRGLTVVAALAARWGWCPDAKGKVVWCELTS